MQDRSIWTKVLMSKLGWEMSQYEVHKSRQLLTIMVTRVQLYAREHPEARELATELVELLRKYKQEQLAALEDPVKRRNLK